MKTKLCLSLTLISMNGWILAGEPTLKQEPNTWVKRSPVAGGPPSPGMGYEAALAYDPIHKMVIRWAGHNQGGGGEQNAETWVYEPATNRWTLKEPNLAPPGVCCAQQNVFDPIGGRYLRFQAFSGSHGWQWFREIYLNNTPVWSYDLAKNTWRDMRVVPSPRLSPLRCASWDSDHQVVVLFGGEGSNEGTLVYDPYDNSMTRMNPPKQPAPRSGGNMAYDAARKLHILFGAQFSNDPHTWAYDLSINEWRDLKPTVQPPTDKNDAVLAYDPHNKVVIAVVKALDNKGEGEGQLQTWAFDAGRNSWTRLKPNREVDGFGNRRRIMVAVPDQNLILLENYANPTDRIPGVEREQQIWTYRYAEIQEKPVLPPPMGLSVSLRAGGADLTWKPSTTAAESGTVIYRGEGTKPWQIQYKEIARVAKGIASFRDDKLQRGTMYHYYVCSHDNSGRCGPASLKVRTQPRTVDDGVASVLTAREVALSWTGPSTDEPLKYHIERAVVEVFSEDQIIRLKKDTPPLTEPSVGGIRAIGPFVRLTAEPIGKTHYLDNTVDLTRPVELDGKPLFVHRFPDDRIDAKGKPYRFAVYAYRIRPVNALGVEGGAGHHVLTIPSSPQWLFSREEGETCHLKWAANPEKGIKGYRVYRMESPRINGPGQPVTRVTPDPVREPRFSDPKAGKVTRRYWVVAVDSLGQEGFPSAPTWFERQYKKYYLPFTAEWHQ